MYVDSVLYKDFHNFIDYINPDDKIHNSIRSHRLKCLCSIEIPGICIHRYIDKIIDNIYQTDSHIDGLIIYTIAIILRMARYIRIDKYNIHRLFAGVLMLSQKMYDDIHYDNDYWSYICGVTLENMNMIELEILLTLDFNLFVSHREMLSLVKCIKRIRNFEYI